MNESPRTQIPSINVYNCQIVFERRFFFLLVRRSTTSPARQRTPTHETNEATRQKNTNQHRNEWNARRWIFSLYRGRCCFIVLIVCWRLHNYFTLFIIAAVKTIKISPPCKRFGGCFTRLVFSVRASASSTYWTQTYYMKYQPNLHSRNTDNVLPLLKSETNRSRFELVCFVQLTFWILTFLPFYTFNHGLYCDI